MIAEIKEALRPYTEQYKRTPRRIKIAAWICIGYLAMPIDPWDVLFPWMAYADDLFIAGVLLKLLHKHGGLPEEDRTTPGQLLTEIKASIKRARAQAQQKL